MGSGCSNAAAVEVKSSVQPGQIAPNGTDAITLSKEA